jgi:hypothetical protein
MTKQVPSSTSDGKVSARLSFYTCVISLELSLREFVMAEENMILLTNFVWESSCSVQLCCKARPLLQRWIRKMFHNCESIQITGLQTHRLPPFE